MLLQLCQRREEIGPVGRAMLIVLLAEMRNRGRWPKGVTGLGALEDDK